MIKEQYSMTDNNVTVTSTVVPTEGEILNRLGQMTRGLHESLRELGLDKMLEQTAQDIPDARDRLNYVATMTEQAAERVLNATDIANPLQDKITSQAEALQENWKAVMEKPLLKREYNDAAEETLNFLKETIENSNATKAQLMDIMMAQDFQDLTGQVIKKITKLANTIEQELVRALVDFSPNKTLSAPVAKKSDSDSLLNGPQIAAEATESVVANQEQVDDLLDSLGF